MLITQFVSATEKQLFLTVNTVILIDTAEQQPIKRALQDLTRDMKAVFGQEPKVIHSLKEASINATLIVVTCRGNSTKSFRNLAINEFEEHLISTKNSNLHKAIVLQGADMRGTIYAIYSFSEKILGIPPLWIWSSYQSLRKDRIPIVDETYIHFPSPTVKWRAWFPNDKDMLSPWLTENANNYDAIFETMLRLKLNTREGYLVDMDSWKYRHRASKEARYARDRGLKISFTHTAPFGATLTNWERYWTHMSRDKKPRPLVLKDLDGLKEFWKYHIDIIKTEKLDVVWQIGFRGLGDKPFWRKTFIDAMDTPTDDKQRALIIQEMLVEQVKLLKQEVEEDHPLMKITIYNEASEFIAANLLKVPDEPNLILNFSNVRHDHYPPSEVVNFDKKLANRPIGYYFNFQFTGTGSHLVPGEGPWKMEQSFKYIEKKTNNNLVFSVVNAGNVKEHLLELSANAAMMWDVKNYDSNKFLQEYCEAYYDKKNAAAIAKLYQAYYQAYWEQRNNDMPEIDRQYVFHDLRYARGITQIATLWNENYLPNPFNDKNKGVGGAMAINGRQFNIKPGDIGAENEIEAVIDGTKASSFKFKEVFNLASELSKKLPENKQVFINDELLVPSAFMVQANTALNNMVLAYKFKEKKDLQRTKEYLKNTLASLTLLKETKDKMNHGIFSNWTKKETIFGIDNVKKDVIKVLKIYE